MRLSSKHDKEAFHVITAVMQLCNISTNLKNTSSTRSKVKSWIGFRQLLIANYAELRKPNFVVSTRAARFISGENIENIFQTFHSIHFFLNSTLPSGTGEIFQIDSHLTMWIFRKKYRNQFHTFIAAYVMSSDSFLIYDRVLLFGWFSTV